MLILVYVSSLQNTDKMKRGLLVDYILSTDIIDPNKNNLMHILISSL